MSVIALLYEWFDTHNTGCKLTVQSRLEMNAAPVYQKWCLLWHIVYSLYVMVVVSVVNPVRLLLDLEVRLKSTWLLVVWNSGNIVRCVNKVTLRRAQLILGWMTVFERMYHLCNQPTRSTRPSLHPSGTCLNCLGRGGNVTSSGWLIILACEFHSGEAGCKLLGGVNAVSMRNCLGLRSMYWRRPGTN